MGTACRHKLQAHCSKFDLEAIDCVDIHHASPFLAQSCLKLLPDWLYLLDKKDRSLTALGVVKLTHPACYRHASQGACVMVAGLRESASSEEEDLVLPSLMAGNRM